METLKTNKKNKKKNENIRKKIFCFKKHKNKNEKKIKMTTTQERAQQQASLQRKGDCQIAIIGDEDSVTGFLLAGIGSVDRMKRTNFLIVDHKTQQDKIINTFNEFINRTDIAIILITQGVADMMRDILDGYDRYLPIVMEIPSKDHPYNPDTDSVMQRLKKMTGRD